jgi:hypothetical protein
MNRFTTKLKLKVRIEEANTRQPKITIRINAYGTRSCGIAKFPRFG